MLIISIELWANEVLINQKYHDYVQLPSDIKPGMYILRTELVALHSNNPLYPKPGGIGGPQFFTHCFNVEIKGDGTAAPPGVKFPGGYKRDDPGVKFNLYTSEAAWDNYVSTLKASKKYEIDKIHRLFLGPLNTKESTMPLRVRSQSFPIENEVLSLPNLRSSIKHIKPSWTSIPQKQQPRSMQSYPEEKVARVLQRERIWPKSGSSTKAITQKLLCWIRSSQH